MTNWNIVCAATRTRFNTFIHFEKNASRAHRTKYNERWTANVCMNQKKATTFLIAGIWALYHMIHACLEWWMCVLNMNAERVLRFLSRDIVPHADCGQLISPEFKNIFREISIIVLRIQLGTLLILFFFLLDFNKIFSPSENFQDW